MAKAEAKYRITADDQTRRGLRSARNSLQRFGQFVRSAIVIPVDVIGDALRAIPQRVREAQEEFRELERLALGTAASLEEARAAQIGAEVIGVDPDTLRDISSNIADLVNETKLGGERAREIESAFAELGTTAEEIGRLPFLSQLATVAEGFRNLAPQRARELSEALSFTGGDLAVLRQDLIGAFGEAGRLGLLSGLGEAVERVRRQRLLDVAYEQAFNTAIERSIGPLQTAFKEAFVGAVTTPLDFGAVVGQPTQAGGFTIGQRSVELQLQQAQQIADRQQRAATDLERSASNLNSASARINSIVNTYQ